MVTGTPRKPRIIMCRPTHFGVQYVINPWMQGHIGRARAHGLEAEAAVTPLEGLELGAAYTLLDAEDRTPGSATNGNDLPRRPRHALTTTADWRLFDGLSLGADLRVVSRAFDDAFNALRLDGYAVLTLRASWDASRST